MTLETRVFIFVELAMLDRFHVSKGPKITRFFGCSKILVGRCNYATHINPPFLFRKHGVHMSSRMYSSTTSCFDGDGIGSPGLAEKLHSAVARRYRSRGSRLTWFQVLGICWFFKSDQWIKSYGISKEFRNMFSMEDTQKYFCDFIHIYHIVASCYIEQ